MNATTTYPKGTLLLLVGTKRGLFLLSSQDRETWETHTTTLHGTRVFYANLDQR